MATQNNGKVAVETMPVRVTTYRENWVVMRPFVHFAFKAMAVIGGALISIIKLLPLLLAEHHKNGPNKNTRIIKIN